MGILDVPAISRAQADARYNRRTSYSTDRYDRAKGLVLPALYNYGDVTTALSTGSSSITNPVLIAGNDSSMRFSGGRLNAPITVTGGTTYYNGGNPTGSALDS